MKHLILCIALLAPLPALAHSYQDTQINSLWKANKDNQELMNRMINVLENEQKKNKALEKRVNFLEQKLNIKAKKK